jgi:hypothetical protein
MRSFRGLRYFLAPTWLTGKGDGEKVAFTLEWLLDAFLEKVRQGLESRFPSRAGASALNLIIGDRGLLRGRNESTADLVARLIAWRTPRTHRVRGNAYEAALQVWHYWREADGTGIYVDIVDAHGVTHSIDANGGEDRQVFAWDWDGADPDVHWSRFWVELEEPAGAEPTPDFGDPALWGGALGTPGYVLGMTNVTPADIFAMRALFQELKWGPAHAIAEWLIIVPVGGAFPSPDEFYRYWSIDVAGNRQAARSTNARYVSLNPVANNTYGGDRGREWSNSCDMPGGGTYDGDRSAAASWGAIPMPNGVDTYTGTRTRFGRNVLFPDDGSVP